MDDRDTGYDEVDASAWSGGPSTSSSQPRHYSSVNVNKTLCSGVVEVSSGPVKYNMNHRRRGSALIISNRNFSGTLGNRPGTETDVERMKITLTGLGFDVDTFEDLTTDKLQACLMAKANVDYSDSDCFLCVIMTHGKEDHILDTEGNEIPLQTLITFFGGRRCPSLVGKPKIFIINACQGEKVDAGHDVADAECLKMSSGLSDDEGDDDEILVQNLPYEQDFLYIHSTMQGYYSFRHTREGSHFIRTLCDVIDKYGDQLEICKLLTVVNRKMAVEFESKAKCSTFHGKKQCPCFLSLLTKQLYFTCNAT